MRLLLLLLIREILLRDKVLKNGIVVVAVISGRLRSQQHASVSQGRICSDEFTCCHTETEVADQTFHLTQSQYTDTGSTSFNAETITPAACQGSHWSAISLVSGFRDGGGRGEDGGGDGRGGGGGEVEAVFSCCCFT